MDQFFQQLVNGLMLGSLYALIAVGYTVVYGIVQLINFAHGEVFMVGAFGALSTYLVLFDQETGIWILPILLAGAVVASVATAVLMERVAYRPLRNAPRLAPLITAIGVSVFLQEFVRLMYDRPWWTVPAMGAVAMLFAYVVARWWARRLGVALPRLAVGAAIATTLVIQVVVRLIYRDVSIPVSLALFVGGAVAGIAVGRLVSRTAPLRPLATAAIVSAVLLETSWTFYEGTIRTIEWPSAKQRIPFPEVDLVTGQALDVGGVTIQRSAIFTVAALVVCAALLWYFINRTRVGRGMQAVSQDPDTARLMGINVDRIIVIAFVLGAVLAAVAGICQGLQNSNIEFRMGFLAGLKAFTAAVLGGIGNIQGAVVGGVVLGLVEAMAIEYIPGQFGGSSWKDVWAFAILILVLVFRPQGLLGARVVDRA